MLEVVRISAEALAIGMVIVLWHRLDQRRAHWERVQFNMALFLRKAVRDRNFMVRIPADLVNQGFNLGLPAEELPTNPKRATEWRQPS